MIRNTPTANLATRQLIKPNWTNLSHRYQCSARTKCGGIGDLPPQTRFRFQGYDWVTSLWEFNHRADTRWSLRRFITGLPGLLPLDPQRVRSGRDCAPG